MDVDEFYEEQFDDYDLAELIKEYNRIQQLPHQRSELEAARFILTGEQPDGGQARIRTMCYAWRPESDEPLVQRDFDSVLGFSCNIPIRNLDIHVYPLGCPGDFLSESLHIDVPWFMGDNNYEWFDPYHAPNILLARFGQREILRIFFPRLSTVDRQSSLSVPERRTFYDEVLLPAIKRSLPTLAHHWPPSFNAEAWRAKNKVHGFQSGTLSISSDDITAFNAAILHYAAKIPWMKGMRFGVQVRGVKNLYYHSPFDYGEVKRDLDSLKANFDTSDGFWWVDVGLEFFAPERAILWRADGHANLVAAITGCSMEEAGNKLRNNRRYRKDLSSHLTSAAGFRVIISPDGGKYDEAFIQAYTTDKIPTYHRDSHGYSKTLTIKNAMKERSIPTYCEDLQGVYTDCREGKLKVAARVEMRVPFKHAEDVLYDPDLEKIQDSLFDMKATTWWNFRLCRLLSIKILLTNMNYMGRAERATISVLTTYAALVWLCNGLHSRPPDDSSGREVAAAALPLTIDYSEDQLFLQGADLESLMEKSTPVPWTPSGILFLRTLVLPPESNSIRLHAKRTLSAKAFKYVFGKSIEEIQKSILPTGFITPYDRNNGRFPMRKGTTHTAIPREDETLQPIVLNLPPMDIEPRLIEFGEDMDVDPPLQVPTIENVEVTAVELWRQFPSDVLQKVGNPRGNKESYCILNMTQREQMTVERFNNPELSRFFTHVQWKKASTKEWAQAFDHFFPPPAHQRSTTGSLHYGKCDWYLSWKGLMGRISRENSVKVRRSLKKLFDELHWVPAVKSDRIWKYDANLEGFTLFPESARLLTAPSILWNPDRPGPTWVNERERREALRLLRREEEEDSSD
ncbi:hypothetical protein BDN72DRAFT_904123 [Pluteus cervinus]|uniref:Uncharacterized protein n=1 Tax=Pluteus cervinus TaxID=181527 RepID=A0ACD3A6U3_9AGAR|nr:hypothetical protein BDN72DRAFT_904123 [Pluteus cervinus]